MKIAVLIKQTPQLSEVTMMGDKPKWPDGTTAVNPFDEYAVEEALRLKEASGGTAIAITYGAADAESVLRDVLALGIDEAYHIESDDYSSTDPQNNAKILAAAINKIGDVNIVLTGKQACDDDSGLVTSAVAGYLDWPQIGFVKKFDGVDADKVTAWRTTDTGYDVVESPLPVVCSVVKEINEPRLPSLKGKMKAKKAPVTKFSLADLGVEQDSLINIKGFIAPKERASGEIIDGEVDEAVSKLVEKLKTDQII